MELWHLFENSKGLETIVDRFDDFERGVARPALVDLLQAVEGDVEIFELWQLEGRPFCELVTLDIEPAQALELILIGEATYVLDLVLANIELNELFELLDHGDIDDVVPRQL